MIRETGWDQDCSLFGRVRTECPPHVPDQPSTRQPADPSQGQLCSCPLLLSAPTTALCPQGKPSAPHIAPPARPCRGSPWPWTLCSGHSHPTPDRPLPPRPRAATLEPLHVLVLCLEHSCPILCFCTFSPSGSHEASASPWKPSQHQGCARAAVFPGGPMLPSIA